MEDADSGVISPSGAARHIISVSVEDYFQGRAFSGVIDQQHWSRFERHVERSTLAALDLLERHDTRGTFFVVGWVAEQNPDLVREIVRRGHEVGSAGLTRHTFRDSSKSAFAAEVRQARDLLENVTGRRIHGYRAADHRLDIRDLWALPVLAGAGYEYDSSLHPSFRCFARQPWRKFVHRQHCGDQSIWEVPLSSLRIAGLDVPVAGGNWFRQLPESFIRHAFRLWEARTRAPFVMYFRVWDLDPDQPKITAGSTLSRARHYRSPEVVARLIENFLGCRRFCGIADYLELEKRDVVVTPQAIPPKPRPLAITSARRHRRTPATVVIPCYNEQAAVPYLANAIADLRQSPAHDFQFIFVDDGSTDRTPDALDEHFGSAPDFRIVKHAKNQGVAAAILTGIRASETEIVCSMDCDCTYDPHELPSMIALLTPDVDMVTASPYHPMGRVLCVPGWRLALSKTASGIYKLVLRQRLSTYTSCFRVYRRSAIDGITLTRPGFLGVAEMLGELDLRGSRIVEYPTTLRVRILGHSKMRIIRTITGHLGLMAALAAKRLFPRPARTPGPDFKATFDITKGLNRD